MAAELDAIGNTDIMFNRPRFGGVFLCPLCRKTPIGILHFFQRSAFPKTPKVARVAQVWNRWILYIPFQFNTLILLHNNRVIQPWHGWNRWNRQIGYKGEFCHSTKS